MSNVSLTSAQISTATQTVSSIYPLAQTFVIDTPGGAFVTSLDLFFKQKDTIDSMPVTVRLRTIENGTPTSVIIPFSTVTVSAANIAVSAAAATPTRFTFEAPIFLRDTTEYCFEITANSGLYKLWCANIGGRDVINPSFLIDKQPYSGVMFKSQNASTWTPELTKDIKFTMYRANFLTSGSVVLNEATIPPVTLDANPLETYTTTLAVTGMDIIAGTTGGDAGYKVITVTLSNISPNTGNTGLAVNDSITISGATNAPNGTWLITSIPVGSGTDFVFRVPSTNTVAIPSPRVLITTGLGLVVKGSKTVRVYHPDHGHVAAAAEVVIAGIVAGTTVNGIPAASINGTHEVTSVEQDSYTIEIASASPLYLAATAAGRCGGNAVTATENRMFDVLYPNVQQLAFQTTNTNWSVRTTNGKSLAGDESPYSNLESYYNIPVNSSVYMPSPKVIRYDPSNPTTKSFYLKATMTSETTTLSPVIDLNRVSVVTINNRLDNPAATDISEHNVVLNYKPETTAHGSSALAKYITRRIDLSHAAFALRMFISINRPAGSSIDVYYKILATDNSDIDFDSLPWAAVSPNSSIPTSSNPNNYTEIEYNVTEEALNNNSGFTAFAVKIVFLSSNSSAAPSCRDFRAIAVT